MRFYNPKEVSVIFYDLAKQKRLFSHDLSASGYYPKGKLKAGM
ncbi:hypothetical protein AXX16_3243 [Serratia rubidaea]|nr:hypothetical protein AXX16_3243 [Serratia rubidaea]